MLFQCVVSCCPPKTLKHNRLCDLMCQLIFPVYRLFNIRIAFIMTPRPAANRLAGGLLGFVIKAILKLNRGCMFVTTNKHIYKRESIHSNMRLRTTLFRLLISKRFRLCKNYGMKKYQCCEYLIQTHKHATGDRKKNNILFPTT